MRGRDLIVVGGSAGSFAPLSTLVRALPSSLQACVLIVVHSSSESMGTLSKILGRSSQLPISIAEDGQSIEPGVFVAPVDQHLIVTPEAVRVTRGPKENGFRPAVDPLFRTAAEAYGPRVIGVLLSGALDDGVYGLSEIKAHGGLAIVQNPDDAEIPSLPRNAIAHVAVDHVLTAAAIASLLAMETRFPREGEVAMSRIDLDDPQLPGSKTDIADLNSTLGPASGLTCPDCGGALWQVKDGSLVRFQCHVGHHYSSDSLVTQQDDRVERALWTAVRTLEERAELRRRMASETAAAGLETVSESFAAQASLAEEQANQIRDVLSRPGAPAFASDVETVQLSMRPKRPRQL